MRHTHQTMTESARVMEHEHEEGEHTHTHEEDGETFQWIAIVLTPAEIAAQSAADEEDAS